MHVQFLAQMIYSKGSMFGIPSFALPSKMTSPGSDVLWGLGS